MGKIQEYKIPMGATMDVCLSPHGAYDAGLDAIKPKYTAGTAGQFARARTAEWHVFGRTDGPLNSSWAWVAEGVVYLSKRFNTDVLFVPKELNLVLKYAYEATQAHWEDREFTITDEHVEQIAGAKGVLRLARGKIRPSIPVEEIGEEPVTGFFGWDNEYGKLLKDRKIKSVPLYLIDAKDAKKQKQAVCHGLWVSNLDDGSAINCDLNLNRLGGCVFGIREQPGGRQELAAPTLEEVLALTRRFPDDISRKELEEELRRYHRRQ